MQPWPTGMDSLIGSVLKCRSISGRHRFVLLKVSLLGATKATRIDGDRIVSPGRMRVCRPCGALGGVICLPLYSLKPATVWWGSAGPGPAVALG